MKISNLRWNILFFITFIIACNSQENGEKAPIILDFKYKIGNNLLAKDWKCYNTDEERVCIPKKWRPTNPKKCVFNSDVNNKDSNSFFVILKYDTTKINIHNYLKETYKQLMQDSAEIFTGYTAKRLIFEKKTTYYCEYYTSKGGKKYVTYSSVFENQTNLFEIALKIPHGNTVHEQEIYKNILFNFSINNIPFFAPNDDLKKINNLKLSL